MQDIPSEPDSSEAPERRRQNLIAIVVILSGLFVGSLFVDFAQLALGRGFSASAVREHSLLETPGKTWVAYGDPKVTVQVVTEKDCAACDPSEALVWLRRVIPTLEAVPIEEDSELGKLLIARFDVPALPAFIFSKNITKTDFYAQASTLFESDGERYLFDMGRIGLPVGRYLKTPRVDAADISVGSSEARVQIIEYSDFQCAYCKEFHADMKKILAEYPGQVRFVYKHLLLPSNPQAKGAALASSCAAEQGRFLPYADHLFARQEEWGVASGTQKFKEYAGRLGLNRGEFVRCLDGGKYEDKLEADREEARRFSISGAPATFVNGTFLNGAVGYAALKQAVDEALAQ